MSAGESDIETDRVSFLHTTALGFAPFIFDLKKDIGFSELIRIFDTVWKEIDENKTLPEKLVNNNCSIYICPSFAAVQLMNFGYRVFKNLTLF